MKHTHKIKLLPSAFSLLITHLFERACFLGWVEYTVGTIQNGVCPKSDHRWRKAPGTTLPALSCAVHGCALWVGPRVAAWQGKRYSFTLPSEASLHLPGPICTFGIELLCPAQVSHTGTCLQRATAGPGADKPQGQFPWFLTRPHGVKRHKRKGFCCPVFRLSADKSRGK